jgi:hypothetical protein
MKKLFALFLLLATSASFAQTRSDLEQFFEGRKIKVKVDMPATKDGLDIYPEQLPATNLIVYDNRIKRFGIAVREGQSVLITKIKVKKDLIEFQLGGGGFGPFFDEGSTPTAEKSLDELRQDRYNPEGRQGAIAEKERRLWQQAKIAGSRFNLRYDKAIPDYALTPEAIMQALAAYVDFGAQAAEANDSRNQDPATLPRLHKGMSDEQVVRVFGHPDSQSNRQEGQLSVNTWLYKKGARTIEAEFVNDVLIKYSIREQ